MTALENKELKGVTGRLIYAIILSTATIVGGGFAAYYGLKTDIMDLKNQNEIKQVQFNALKAQVDMIQVQVNALQERGNK